MGCRVIRGEGMEALYCSTTMWAFGPVMGDGEGEAFLTWMRQQALPDPRRLEDSVLERLYSDFRAEQAKGGGDAGL